MSASNRRAWFSCTSRPVRANSARRWWPGSATPVRSRSRLPAARVVDQFHLVDVEPELVEPPDPFGDAEALLAPRDDLLAGELPPQVAVPAGQGGRGRPRGG